MLPTSSQLIRFPAINRQARPLTSGAALLRLTQPLNMACRSPLLPARRSLFRLPLVGALLAVLLTSALTASSAWIINGCGQQQQSRRAPMRARSRMVPMMAAAGAGGKPG